MIGLLSFIIKTFFKMAKCYFCIVLNESNKESPDRFPNKYINDHEHTPRGLFERI